MEIEFDPVKRELTLEKRGLDFLDAPKLFEARSLTVIDDRVEYDEERFITYGYINGVAVAMVWTDRNAALRVISMRRMHLKEISHVGLD